LGEIATQLWDDYYVRMSVVTYTCDAVLHWELDSTVNMNLDNVLQAIDELDLTSVSDDCGHLCLTGVDKALEVFESISCESTRKEVIFFNFCGCDDEDSCCSLLDRYAKLAGINIHAIGLNAADLGCMETLDSVSSYQLLDWSQDERALLLNWLSYDICEFKATCQEKGWWSH
jgi:hypothetical protein